MQRPKKDGSVSIETRKINEGTIDLFRCILSQQDFTLVSELCENKECNKAYATFLEIVPNIYNQSFPLIKKSKRKKPMTNPWMTKGLLKPCRKKNKLYLKFIKQPNSTNEDKFITYRNKFKMIKIKAERLYYATEFTKYSKDIKQTWNVI